MGRARSSLPFCSGCLVAAAGAGAAERRRGAHGPCVSPTALITDYPTLPYPSVQSAWARPQELVQLNVLKGMKETLVSKELMGRAAIPLRPFTDKAGEPVDMWVDLGKGEWANEDGTVRP